MARRFQEGEISVQVSAADGCMKDICVEIAHARFRDEKAEVLGEMMKEIVLPGFRKGKVPRDIIERRFADEIHAEAIKSILPLAYEHLVASEGFEPLGDPKFGDIKAEADMPLTFQVSVEVAPKLDIGEYRGISVAKEEVAVTDEEIEEVIKSLQQRSADYTKVDRAAAAGDVVVLDFGPVGKDGAVKEKKRVRNYPVQLGAGQIFPSSSRRSSARGRTQRAGWKSPTRRITSPSASRGARCSTSSPCGRSGSGRCRSRGTISPRRSTRSSKPWPISARTCASGSARRRRRKICAGGRNEPST